MRAANGFNLNRRCSRSLLCRPCSLAVALYAHSHGLAEVHVGVIGYCEIYKFECAHLKFMVSGRSKQA